jgi:hypothetical protein
VAHFFPKIKGLVSSVTGMRMDFLYSLSINCHIQFNYNLRLKWIRYTRFEISETRDELRPNLYAAK